MKAFYVPVTEQLQPISARWLEIVSDRIRSLAETTEQLQEIDSPYIVGVPSVSNSRSSSVDRTSARGSRTSSEIGQPVAPAVWTATDGKDVPSVQPGTAPSDLDRPLLVDLQGPPAQSESSAGFLYQLAAAMTDSARRQRDVGALPHPGSRSPAILSVASTNGPTSSIMPFKGARLC